LECGAVAVLLELLPGVEDVPGDLEPVEPERLLRAEVEVGVEGEVAAQMRPADLAPLRLEAVVGTEAIRADDAGEPVADQSVQMSADLGSFHPMRDTKRRRLRCQVWR
jgi:hypothetical protein